MSHNKTLYRLPDQAILGGVIAGLADYLNIDISIGRLLYLFITLATGIVPGVITYIVMLAILPTPDQVIIETTSESTKPSQARSKDSATSSDTTARNVIGGGFILLGAWYLLSALSLLPTPQWQTVMPLLLIIFGVLLLKKQ